MRSDARLLKRVLVNMLKNAFEASSKGSEIAIDYSFRCGKIVFRVWNEGVIPDSVQLQIFQRSFSTKGVNRGLGTYGMKLLAEQYLQGSLYFFSSEKTGTEFVLELPVSLPEEELKQSRPS